MPRQDGDANDRSRATWLFLLPPLAFAAVVFYPITHNYFFDDDFLNLYQIANDRFLQYWVTPNGGHIHLTRNVIFYLSSRLFGTHPEPYYWSAFLTHLVNVWLLFRVIHVLTHSARLACFGATLWGISPFNEGTLGWYAVYGHALAGTALLVILHQALRAAAAERPPSRRTLWLWFGLALMAATSFGTGVGVAMVLPFVLCLLLPTAGGRVASWRLPPLISLVVVMPALYAVTMWAYQTLSDSAPLFHAALTLTTPTAIPLYSAHLIALGLTRLLLGAYFPSWLTVGAWYGVLACGAVALIGTLLRSDGQVRRQIAACTLLLLGCYGMVALGRSFLLAQWPMSIFVLQSRYHYEGQLILTIMLCLLLNGIAPIVPPRARTAALLAWYGLAIVVSARYGTPIDNHPEARQDTEHALTAIRAAIEAQPPGHAVYITNQPFKHLPLPSFFPGWVAVFVIFYPDDTVDGRRVYFVDARRTVLGAAQRGKRTPLLIVPSQPPSGM